MIDFEKSRTLAENPFMSSGGIEPRRLWPTEELGAILKQSRPPRCPGSVVNTITSISLNQLNDSVLPVAAELPFVHWHMSSVELLLRRAQNIIRLVEDVWATN
jgi:hypothetical protein